MSFHQELDWSVSSLISRGEIDETWRPVLAPVESTLIELASGLAGTDFLPAPEHVFRALRMSREAVRVLILGQDPYPTRGYAMGLAFSVSPEVSVLPGSLRNIFRELGRDLGNTWPSGGDLTAWNDRGVMLLNTVLTVTEGDPLSHRALGWNMVTDAVIESLRTRPAPLVVLAWGRQAVSASRVFDGESHIRVVPSAHPSPLSASRGFFSSRPFSRANAALAELGEDPIDWTLN